MPGSGGSIGAEVRWVRHPFGGSEPGHLHLSRYARALYAGSNLIYIITRVAPRSEQQFGYRRLTGN